MNDILSEKEYQRYIINKLVQNNGYVKAPATDFDRLFAINRKALFSFLQDTQGDKLAALQKIYKDKMEETLISCINQEETTSSGSRLSVLKHGIDLANIHFDLMYTKPATTYNKKLNKLYEKNIFTVSEEVWASDKERVDLVIFLNGLAVMTFELKCNTAGQSYQDAIYQYRTARNPKDRLFRWKAGALVNFAMDLEQVYMCTKLSGASTFFLPFNMGCGEGIQAGAGNPVREDEYSVHYMWDNILQKDSLLEIFSKFMFIEVSEKEDAQGKIKKNETVIFPRYHQLDVLRKILADVKKNKSSLNYLLQHSAGSGKTNEIAWLAHRLASLHDDDNHIIFDNIVICTDRVVVDRQLQKAVMGIEHQEGLIRVMDDSCNSLDLANALSGNTKIIATTIQKFPYIVDSVKGLKDKRFAVIIDEAHSSTSGKNMAAITKSLSSEEVKPDVDAEDMITHEITHHGKQPNVSIFAFTATPKPTTLRLFGRVNAQGQYEAFHIYSMKQAIEEGFILDVLQNYMTYNTFYHLNKEIAEDPEIKTNDAKRQIARFVQLHETNISQRTEIIIEHFRQNVMKELNGQAKAMVITESRKGAVKYRQAFEAYIKRKGYTHLKALVAFSGKVTLHGKEYTEAGMNGISEKKLPAVFDTDEYQVLLVADKYQTGFDQKKLCAMYILKKLHGVNAVQTLSRLNRICPPFDKKTFVLDFANEYTDMEKAFSTYYTGTFLANSLNSHSIYAMSAKIDGYFFLNPGDIEDFNTLLYKEEITAADKKEMVFLLHKAKHLIETNYDEEKQTEIQTTVRHFIRCYEFFIQATCFKDIEMHKKYKFLSYLQTYFKARHSGGGFDLTGKIKADHFVQKKSGEFGTTKHTADPIVTLPTSEPLNTTSARTEKLSQIIEEINSKTGKNYDARIASKAILQINEQFLKSKTMQNRAQHNKLQEFALVFFDEVDSILSNNISQNEDFFELLLNNDEIKHRLFDTFVDDIYIRLRQAAAGSSSYVQPASHIPAAVADTAQKKYADK